jgi:tetratricopeptide (TPR) repeat protein
MSDRVRRAVLAGLCWIAGACATSSAKYFARMDEKGRSLINRQQWEEALGVSQKALSKCDLTDWCSKDPRYQGLFHTTIGGAQEHLGRRDLAMQHYRAAFYAYPLYFTENYFRLLRESGMLRQLRREIDVKLANNENAYRSAAAFWLSPSEPSACRGRLVAGTYSWRLRATKGSRGSVSGKVLVSETGCAVTVDFPPAKEQPAGTPLRLRADIESGAAVLLYGLPCVTTDKGRLIFEKNGFTFNADRTDPIPGCSQGPYAIEFVKD